MAMIPVLNPRPRLKRAGRKRFKFGKRSPFKGFKVNPRRRKRRTSFRRKRNIGELAIMGNPRRRHRRKRSSLRIFGNPRRRHHFRRRRNPAISIGRVFAPSTLIDAVWGGVGFIGAKTVVNWLPVPVMFKSGPMKLLTGAVSAWGLSAVAGMTGNKRIGNLILVGGLIGVAVDAVSLFAPQLTGSTISAPPSTAGLLGYVPRMGAYLNEGMGDTAW